MVPNDVRCDALTRRDGTDVRAVFDVEALETVSSPLLLHLCDGNGNVVMSKRDFKLQLRICCRELFTHIHKQFIF